MLYSRPRVFIASSSESLPLAHALKALLHGDARPTVWNEGGVFGVSQYTLDELLRASGEYDFAAFIFSAEDTVESRGSRFLVARDNVLLELGLFAGKLGRERVFVVAQHTPEPLRLPSDLHGLGTTTFRWPAGAPFGQVDAEVLQTALRPCAEAIRTGMRRAGRGDQPVAGRIEGRRLFEHEGYYPIDIAPGTNRPSLNSEIFSRAIRHFLEDEHHDRLAAMDLVYLREDNLDLVGGSDVLLPGDRPFYEQLVEKYGLLRFIENFRQENERVFGNFIRIVNDIGDTLRGVHFEILLHNVRNPLRSIIAARNSEEVSGRLLYDPSTRFVVQFVRNQGKLLITAMQGEGKVSYLKQFNRTRRVKATTTPLYHNAYGLVGILCVNIDIDAVNALDDEGLRRFREKYVENTGVTPEFEKEAWGVG